MLVPGPDFQTLVGTVKSVRFLNFTNAAGRRSVLAVPELLSHEHDGLSQIRSRLVIKGIVGEFEGLFWGVRNFRRVFKGFWLLQLFINVRGQQNILGRWRTVTRSGRAGRHEGWIWFGYECKFVILSKLGVVELRESRDLRMPG